MSVSPDTNDAFRANGVLVLSLAIQDSVE